jgi:mono/diheme cytochrome c family protein
MEKDTIKIQLVKAIERLMFTLFLLVCTIGLLGLMPIFKKPIVENKVTTNAVVSKSDSKVKLGKTLFVNNCAQCHAKDMTTKMTGPALSGVRNKWNDDAALYDWITKSTVPNMKTGYIDDLKKAYGNIPMPRFRGLTEGDVKAILAYIDKF